VRPSFRLTVENAAAVAQVCRLLDGLPLAIELAASRIKLFAPQALVRRLDDRLGLLSGGASDSPIRHRALRTTIDWSYDLLSPAERHFFCDLNVFSGGATYDAIEAVVPTPDSDAGDVLEMLTSLVNHSLVRQREDDETEARFHMLQVLRDYALEVANRDPEHQHDVRERHAQYFLAMARRVRGVGKGLSPQEAELDLEADNMRAALDFWLANAAAGDGAAGDKALSLAAPLGFHWYYHGQAREGARRLDAALAAAVDPPKDDLALAIRMLGVMVQHLGKAERAVGLLERAVALHQEIGDRSGEAACLNSLGAALRVLMRFAEAEQRLSEAAVVREELGEPGGLIAIHNNLGLLYMDQGRVAEAKVLFADNLVLDRQRDDAWGAACSMLNLGVAHLMDGEIEEARALVAGAIDAFVEVEDADGLAEILEACVGLAAAQNKWATGMRLAGAAAAFRELIGLVVPEPDRVMIDRWVSRCREHLDPKAFAQARAEGTEMTLEQATAYARSEVLAPPPA
jgi:tetratricopeptide (TPR) repeat protein